MAKVIPVEFPTILDKFFTSVAVSRVLKKGWRVGGGEWGVESGGWKAGKRLTTKWTRMVTEGTRPQNNLSEAGSRLKLHKTDIHHTFSSLIICPECMNLVTALQNLAVPICIFQMVSISKQKQVYYCIEWSCFIADMLGPLFVNITASTLNVHTPIQ